MDALGIVSDHVPVPWGADTWKDSGWWLTPARARMVAGMPPAAGGSEDDGRR